MRSSASRVPQERASDCEVQEPRSNVKVTKGEPTAFPFPIHEVHLPGLGDHTWLPPGRRRSAYVGEGTNATINGTNRPFSRNTKRRTDDQPGPHFWERALTDSSAHLYQEEGVWELSGEHTPLDRHERPHGE